MVIGGTGDGGKDKLSPVAINIDKKDQAYVEKCGNKKSFDEIASFKKGPLFVSGQGHFLSGSLVLCPQSKNKCTMIGRSEVKTFKTKYDHFMPASIKLNDSTLWITNRQGHTEFITADSSEKGISLPFEISRHCMVMLEPNHIIMIGGQYNFEYKTKKTWIIDTENEYNITDGPLLNEGRVSPTCGKLKDEFGNVLVVVTSEKSVEILNTTLMNEWIPGELKFVVNQNKSYLL